MTKYKVDRRLKLEKLIEKLYLLENERTMVYVKVTSSRESDREYAKRGEAEQIS